MAVRGKPFYDWDAWAVVLLSPQLWRRRGPWHRLIACCAAAKPPHVDFGHVPDVKAALVRIVVAEVVSQLVSRTGDNLTPEDRNWITSVASRQRGRHARKPTLMLLFDLAFAVFDLAAFCRRCKPLALSANMSRETDPNSSHSLHNDRIALAIREIVSHACQSSDQDLPLPRPETNSAVEGMSLSDTPASVDPVVRQVLDVVHERGQNMSDSWIIDNVNRVIDAIENMLSANNARRWHHYFTSKVEAANDGITQAAYNFARRLPLESVESAEQLLDGDALSRWLMSSLDGSSWMHWAELANDCNYIILTGSIPEELVRNMICRLIITNLAANSQITVDGQLLGSIVERQLKYDAKRLTVRRLLDLALGLEQFYAFFVETYANETATGSCVTWGVLCFEGLVQLLSGLREVVISGTSRERAMIEWSARSLDISNYYRKVTFGNEQMCGDIDRVIQNAFSEASWMPIARAMRYMVHPVPQAKSGVDSENPQMPCFWVASLDLIDPVNLAAAIVPWDPRRALALIDQAIGLSEDTMADIYSGKEGIPLWDYRRINLCRLLTFRGNPHQTALIMERLQLLFDQRSLHEGGNFSGATISLLEAATKEHNFCAQTTHGLLLAGQGTYWDVARSWANCEKSIADGIRKLYLSAEAGDLEACTALSHIWAQGGPESADFFRGVTLEQVYKLFKIAVTSQNAKAVMNMGVIWRYGNVCVQSNSTVATDAFLMALQGGIFGEARAVAARHLAETIGQNEAGVSKVLALLTCVKRSDISACSPHRIDDFCGSN